MTARGKYPSASVALRGLDLRRSGVVLPSAEPAPRVTVQRDHVDSQGTLAIEPDAARVVAGWKAIPGYGHVTRRGEAAITVGQQAAGLITALQHAASRGTVRGFQGKTLYASTTARFLVAEGIPAELQAGPFQPGAGYRAIVRFSSSASTSASDAKKDQRAVGVRIIGDQDEVQDLTLTSGSSGNHARDAAQFNHTIRAAVYAARGGLRSRLRALGVLLARVGIRETLRILWARRKAVDAGVSLAALAYYSRSPFELGSRMVQMRLAPLDRTEPDLPPWLRGTRSGLGRDLCQRRRQDDVRFRFQVSEAPSVTDTSVSVKTQWITVGELRLPRQDEGEARMLDVAQEIHATVAMHPFNQWAEGVLVPRGELNELIRRPAYWTSAHNTGRADGKPAIANLGA